MPDPQKELSFFSREGTEEMKERPYYDTASIGRRGENRVAWHYRLRGYRILARNFRASHDEIDLIAENRSTLVFIEVKTRVAPTGESLRHAPADAVDAAKIMHLSQAARSYVLEHQVKKPFRFDIAEVYGIRKGNGSVRISRIQIKKNAFHAPRRR